jgi:hypothetical protein
MAAHAHDGPATVREPAVTVQGLHKFYGDVKGVGSAVVSSSRQVGGSVGIALMGAIVAHEAGGSATPEAFMNGFSDALLVASGIALAGAVAALVLVRSHAESSRPRVRLASAGVDESRAA